MKLSSFEGIPQRITVKSQTFQTQDSKCAYYYYYYILLRFFKVEMGKWNNYDVDNDADDRDGKEKEEKGKGKIFLSSFFMLSSGSVDIVSSSWFGFGLKFEPFKSF